MPTKTKKKQLKKLLNIERNPLCSSVDDELKSLVRNWRKQTRGRGLSETPS